MPVRFALQPGSSDNRMTAANASSPISGQRRWNGPGVIFSDYLGRIPEIPRWSQKHRALASRPTIPMAGESVQKRLLTVSELSTYLGVPKNSIYTMVCLKKLPGVVHLGRALRFEKAAIDAWISARLEVSDAPAPRRA